MSNWPDEALERSGRRRQERFAEGVAQRAAWMVECRDMWDAHDADAGVYFVLCAGIAEVDELVREMPEDSPDNRVLGIYDLSQPLAAQGGGLKRFAWLERKDA